MKKQRRKIRIIMCFLPAFIALIGIFILLGAAGASDFGIMTGAGSPEWTFPAACAGLFLFAVGLFLSNQ